MQAILDFVTALTALLGSSGPAGWASLIIVVFLLRGKAIGEWLGQKVFKPLFPLLFERRQATMNRLKDQEDYERVVSREDRHDTVAVLKEVLIDHRERNSELAKLVDRQRLEYVATVRDYEAVTERTQVVIEMNTKRSEVMFDKMVAALTNVSDVLRVACRDHEKIIERLEGIGTE